MAASKCKICADAFPNFDSLKKHWKLNHTQDYVRVRQWLAEVDEAVVIAECVVQEQEKGEDPRENARHSHKTGF